MRIGIPKGPAGLSCALAVAFACGAPAIADAGETGRLLVTLRGGASAAGAAAPATIAAAHGARRAGWSVPQIGLVTLRPGAGESASALAARLRADPRVATVEREHRAQARYVPNDPALTTPEQTGGPPPGTSLEWWAARQGFPLAWDISRGNGATVAVIDTGIETSHPELVGRIRAAKSFDAAGPPSVDSAGHGTHVASLACAASDNGAGLAGAGLHCRLLAIRSDLTDSSVAAAIVWAADHGADAINMSFGTNPGEQPSRGIRDAITYAARRRVVLVAAAADRPIEEQGYPANLLQPTGSGPALAQGSGLTVTAADASDQRASFAGFGTQISIAAYGTYYSSSGSGPRGIFGAFTAQTNTIETGDATSPSKPPCRCRITFNGDNRYAYVQGTSMAAPMVAAAAALIRHLNPDLRARDIVALLKYTARRAPGSGWSPELGWGILDAGTALQAARSMDRRAPSSRVHDGPRARPAGRPRLRWTGTDRAPRGVLATGVVRYELWRSLDGRRYRRLLSSPGRTAKVTLRRGARYAFYSVAVDRAGNRERPPSRPDIRIRVSR